jgi:hypothetical protein
LSVCASSSGEDQAEPKDKPQAGGEGGFWPGVFGLD